MPVALADPDDSLSRLKRELAEINATLAENAALSPRILNSPNYEAQPPSELGRRLDDLGQRLSQVSQRIEDIARHLDAPPGNGTV